MSASMKPPTADREQAAYLLYQGGDDAGCLVACKALSPESGRRYLIEGLVAERQQRLADARRLYTRAHRLNDPVGTLQLRYFDAHGL